MALRIVPQKGHPTAITASIGAPSAPGVHDTLRHNLGLTFSSSTTTSAGPAPAEIQSSHPLETRLARWQATQDSLRMETLRRQFGLAEPVRRGMELSIARAGEAQVPIALGGSRGLHSDILAGRDMDVAWEDIYRGDVMRPTADFHSEMEHRLRMNW